MYLNIRVDIHNIFKYTTKYFKIILHNLPSLDLLKKLLYNVHILPKYNVMSNEAERYKISLLITKPGTNTTKLHY